jgi:histidinol-phosphatase (PHP family)
MLPTDSHVHTQFSWDAEFGSMEAACQRAVDIGLSTIAFTEHFDPTPWELSPEQIEHVPPFFRAMFPPEGVFVPPPPDMDAYTASIEQCRERFPELRILTGIELGEPHWWSAQTAAILARGNFDRVLGSVHTVRVDGRMEYSERLFEKKAPDDVIHTYLAEVLRLVESSEPFSILAHIDYPVRGWPTATAGPYNPARFEDEHRTVLKALAKSGRLLELNTTIPLNQLVLRWWKECDGAIVSIGSDAHEPRDVARRFAEVSAMVQAEGLRVLE